MKKFIQALAMLAFLAMSQFVGVAHAQFGVYCSGTYRVGNCNGPEYFGYASRAQVQGVTIVQPVQLTTIRPPIVTQHFVPAPRYVSPPVIYGEGVISQGVSASRGLTRCQAVGGLLGGTIGSLAHNHTGQAIVGGAVIGGIVGDVICSDDQGRQVRVNRQRLQANQPQVVQGSTQWPVTCNTAGTSFGVSSDAHCAHMAARLSGAAQQNASSGNVVAQQQAAPQAMQVVTRTGAQPAAPSGVCRVETGTITYRFNAVDGVKFDKGQCGRYLDKSDPLPAKESMSIM